MGRNWYTKDGQLDVAALDELEGNLKAMTDKVGGYIDRLLGKGFVPAFRCAHSGLLYPGDYLKKFGQDYGIGLGNSPVSECWDSIYELEPNFNNIRGLDQVMHPVRSSCAQVDYIEVHPATLEDKLLIAAKDDPHGEERSRIVRANQLKNPQGRLQVAILQAQQKGVR